jgi:hypothetical protein
MSTVAKPLPLAVLAALPTGGRARRATPSRHSRAKNAIALLLTRSFLSLEQMAPTGGLPPSGGDGRQARAGLSPRRALPTPIFKQETPHVPRS